MISAAGLTFSNVAGLFVIDSAGTVCSSRFKQNNELINLNPHLAGRNFFHEIVKFKNVRDFQNIFKNFVKSSKRSDNFVFNCRFTGLTVKIGVVMMKAAKNRDFEPPKIVIFFLDGKSKQ